MEAINYITRWVNWLLIIIPVAAGVMCAYQGVKKSTTADEGVINQANKMISQTIKGAIIAMSISGLIVFIRTFY